LGSLHGDNDDDDDDDDPRPHGDIVFREIVNDVVMVM
jgi:hypothetical protein